MNYICYRRCHHEKSITGALLNIPRGTELKTIGDIIAFPDSKAICYQNSQIAREYFAPNDDGKGLEKGDLIYKIAFAPRQVKTSTGNFRFSEEQQELLWTKYFHFLNSDHDVILFSSRFFNATLEELEDLAKALKLK